MLVQVIQASSTELFDDEAYYWIYSIFPSWGYFDHPPMIAMLIKAGYAIFHNELGVRLLTIFLNTASIFLIETLLTKKNHLLFYAICATIALAQIGGMMAVPDTPLMFFVALFFCLYKRFIANMNITNTLLLGVSIALMLYTKYHGVLVVFFTLLSRLKLLRHYQTYVIMVVSAILFMPHIYWQYLHGFPSVQFHLFERNAVDYEFKTTIEFVLGQIVLAGPLMGWLLILAALKNEPVSPTERALKFSFVGIYIFFLLSTLKGRAEANWTIASFIGMIVLSHQYLLENKKWRRWLYYSVPFTLLLVLATRIFMMINRPAASWLAKDEVHGNKTWVSSIQHKAGNTPVVFLDSYQKPSKYRFYSGNTSMALNTPAYRRNNYNFWKIEDSLIGKPVYIVGRHIDNTFKDVFNTPHLGKEEGKSLPFYYSFSRILINNITTGEIRNGKLSVGLRSITPPSYLQYFQRSPYDTASIFLVIYKKKKIVAYLPSYYTLKNITAEDQQYQMEFPIDLERGNYTGKIAISSCIPGKPSLNSSGISIKIK